MRWRTFCRVGLVVYVAAMLVLLVAAMLGRVDARDPAGPAPSPPAPPSTAWIVANLPPSLSPSTTAAATVAVQAARGPQIQVAEPPVFDPAAFCNSLEYRATFMEPAMACYRAAALWLGWDRPTVEARATFVFRVMATESAGCWNARRWTYFDAGRLCTEHKVGVNDDVGFGQLTNAVRHPSDALCGVWRICNWQATIPDPWTSMLSFVIVMDDLGRGPWCYRDASGRPNMHMRNGDCATWPG